MSRKILHAELQNLSRGYNNIIADTNYFENEYNFKTLEFITNEEISKEDRLSRLLVMAKHEVMPKDKEKFDMIISNMCRFIKSCGYESNGRRILAGLVSNCQDYDYMDADLYHIISIIVKRAITKNEKLVSSAWAILKYWDSKVERVKRQDCCGDWQETTDRRFRRHDYHDHPNHWDDVTPLQGLKAKESKKGFEVEGVFPTEKEFQECMKEMYETDFEGGKLYDERNFLMPTYDGSIMDGYSVEFWFCPMSTVFAKKFFKVFNEILKKHGWESSFEEHGSGTHCHLDACLFNQITLRKLIDKVYDMPEEEQNRIYKRTRGNNYNDYSKRSCYYTEARFVMTDLKTKEGNTLYERKPIIYGDSRRTLLNLQHIRYPEENNYDVITGTVELRGADGSCDPMILCDEYDKLVAEAIM